MHCCHYCCCCWRGSLCLHCWKWSNIWLLAIGKPRKVNPLIMISNFWRDYFLPMHSYPHQLWDIWINMCIPLRTQICGPGTAGCMQWDPQSEVLRSLWTFVINSLFQKGMATMGMANTLSFSLDEKNNAVTALWTNGSEHRGMKIQFKCDPAAGVRFATLVGL